MTQSQLAEALGLSKGQVSKLVDRGMPADDVAAAIAWRQANLRPEWTLDSRDPGERKSGSTADDYLVAKTRKEQAQAELAELELAREKRRLCVADDVHRALYAVHRMLRDQLLSVPNRIASEVGALPPHAAAELMRAELRRCLEEFESLAESAVRTSTGQEGEESHQA